MSGLLSAASPAPQYGLLSSRDGLAENIKHPRMYDAARAIDSNVMSRFLLGGLSDWLMTTAKGGRTSPMQNLMAGLDATPPGVDDMAVKGLLAGGAAASKMLPGLLGMTAYHGSPHLFNKFDISKIGTGEGAQAYGHGLYFAENPQVAGQYAKQVSGDYFDVGGEMFNPDVLQHLNIRSMVRRGDLDGAIIKAREFVSGGGPVSTEAANDLAVLEGIKARGGMKPANGHLYNVDIPDSAIDNMLDWDKPLSEQPESVRKALSKLDPDFWSPNGADYDPSELGQSIYHRIASTKKTWAEASEALKASGVPGIKYLDQGSRTAGKGTRNFVVFDDSLPKIIKRE